LSRAAVLVCLVVAAGAARARAAGPDVIVGDLPDVYRWGRDAAQGITAYSIGTTACNLGDQNAIWVANTNQHPVIAQNLFRLKAGRFEQIGMSWLKHSFVTVAEGLCGFCNGQSGSVLGVGCSDPYAGFINGSQNRLGPRSEVNPATGYFPYPFGTSPASGLLAKRLQVRDVDLDLVLNAGAIYFLEGQYVTPDDAAAGNQNNNASYRRCEVTDRGGTQTYEIDPAGTTQRMQPAIRAWKDFDPGVTLDHVDVPGDGRLWVGSRATDLGGGVWHYEYAVQNLTSERAAGSFSVPIPAGATISNTGFHDIDYHSGEPFSGADWTPTVGPASLSWATEPHAQNANANALRWGTLYNFRFDADAPPTSAAAAVGLFKPGPGPAGVFAVVVAPAAGDCNTNAVPDNADVLKGTSGDCNFNGVPDECELAGDDCDANGTPDACELIGNDCNANGTPDGCDAALLDCNSNGTPDDCELAGNDCDSNRVPDDCQLAANDCNASGTPDHCELLDNDCDSNGLPDDCQLAANDCNANDTPDHCDVVGVEAGLNSYSSGALELAVPDNHPPGAMHAINVSVQGVISDVNILLNVSHTRDSDLVLSVVHAGVTVTLCANVGGNGQNFNFTFFDDEAAVPISSGSAPFNGSYRPQQPLSAFDGLNVYGPWTLRLVDTAPGAFGTLNSWLVNVSTAARPAHSPDVNANLVPDECECLTCPGDLNGDGRIDGDDVQDFVACYLGGDPAAPGCACSDLDLGSTLDAADVDLLADALLGVSDGDPLCP